MSDTPISDDHLHAFIDDQLDSSEKARVLEAIRTDPELARNLQSLQNNKDMLILTYSGSPTDIALPDIEDNWYYPRTLIAASIMLTLSSILGWFGHDYFYSNTNPFMQPISEFNSTNVQNDRVLLHINSMDEKRINNILTTAERILKYRDNNNQVLKLEIVANESGLGLLRDGSPYQKRIKSITSQYTNVSFLACGIAMEIAHLKEGKNIELIPEAKKINSAIDKILNRIKGGWTYVQG